MREFEWIQWRSLPISVSESADPSVYRTASGVSSEDASEVILTVLVSVQVGGLEALYESLFSLWPPGRRVRT